MQIIRGKVVSGLKKGTDLGFPTANIRSNKKIAKGIYISQTKMRQNIYPSLTFIDKETETYLLDFTGDLYGRWVTVKLFKKIRKSKKFKSDKDLVLQMKSDELVARKFFNMLV